MLLQAIAEYGVTNSGVSLGSRINRAANWLGGEVGDVAEAASRNPATATLVVALVLASSSLGRSSPVSGVPPAPLPECPVSSVPGGRFDRVRG